MSKRRSDWESRPQARFRKWYKEGFLALDNEIIDHLTRTTELPENIEDRLIAQQEEMTSRQHERTLALSGWIPACCLGRTGGRKAISPVCIWRPWAQ